MKLLIFFIFLNVANVIIQTAKSILTINGGKVVAALSNAVCYGLYTIVLIYMTCDLPTFTKALIVAMCNLIGVYVVKLIEEKSRKDKLWKIEVTARQTDGLQLMDIFDNSDISYNIIATNDGNYYFNIFSKSQKESATVKDILKKFNVKYFVSESKIL